MDLKCHLYGALRSSMFWGLFLNFIVNSHDLFWANGITAFLFPIYSYLTVEHFAFGDVLEHR